MTLASGVGSMPGEDQRALEEAVRVVLGELGDAPAGMPFVPEVPGRGAGATMTGRALAVVTDLDADLQPAGWRLTGSAGAPGVDQRRARSLLAQDLDFLEEAAEGYTGPFKTQVCGPWTLAATVERPRGDRVLADHGARRELAQALAEGVRSHVRDLRRRIPGCDRLVVQLDEPALPVVMSGRVPTASGFHRHRSVEPPVASEALAWVIEAVAEEGAEPWVHCCASEAPLSLLRGAGARGLAVDLDQLAPADHDALAEALEAGDAVALGVVATAAPGSSPPGAGALTERVERWLDLTGLDPAGVAGELVLTPACGMAGVSSSFARAALSSLREAAGNLG